MKNLYKALADFQAEVPNIYKNAKGYNYKFADLGEINDVIKPLLTKHGLGYAQPLEGASIKTILFHVESGESLESVADVPQGVKLNGMNDFQVLGSAITYLRRYSLSSMLGLITDEDADAAGEQVKIQPPKQIRDRKAESAQGPNAFSTMTKDEFMDGVSGSPRNDPELMGEEGKEVTFEERLTNAKKDINKTLEQHDYIRADQKKTFITMVLEKATIDSIEDAHLVMDALDNEGDNGINQDGSYKK